MTKYGDIISLREDLNYLNEDEIINLDEMAYIDEEDSGVDCIFQLFTSPKMTKHSLRVKFYPEGRRKIGELSFYFKWDDNELKFCKYDSNKKEVEIDLPKKYRLAEKWVEINRRKIISYSLHAWSWKSERQRKFLNSMTKVIEE